MKKQFRDMMVYVVIILVVCFVGPVLYQKVKTESKNTATVVDQKNKYDSAENYEEVLHYKKCKKGTKYETVATVWVLGKEKKIIQQATVQFTAKDETGDVYFQVRLPKIYHDMNVNTVFSNPTICK